MSIIKLKLMPKVDTTGRVTNTLVDINTGDELGMITDLVVIEGIEEPTRAQVTLLVCDNSGGPYCAGQTMETEQAEQIEDPYLDDVIKNELE